VSSTLAEPTTDAAIIADLTERLRQLEQQREQALATVNYLQGAIDEVKRLLAGFAPSD
jgi:hypothetical protein